MHSLHSHLKFFSPNLGRVNDEYGERFHQDISDIEKRYQGKWKPSMFAEYLLLEPRKRNPGNYKPQMFK